MNSSPRIYKCFGVSHAEAACLQGSRPDFDLLKSWTFWILVDLLAHLWWNPSFYRISQNFERSQLLTPGKFDIFGSSKSAPTKNLKILIFQELGPSIHRFFFLVFPGFPMSDHTLEFVAWAQRVFWFRINRICCWNPFRFGTSWRTGAVSFGIHVIYDGGCVRCLLWYCTPPENYRRLNMLSKGKGKKRW